MPPRRRTAAVLLLHHVVVLVSERLSLAVTTWPSRKGWIQTVGITTGCTFMSGAVAVATDFVQLHHHSNVKATTLSSEKEKKLLHVLRSMLSAFIVPPLVEELIWRAALLPHPRQTMSSTLTRTTHLHPFGVRSVVSIPRAVSMLGLHVLFHPILGESGLWPRGKDTFRDPRFLVAATVVLGGATASYIVTGGSIFAAAFAHGVPVILWRDFFGGEERLGLSGQQPKAMQRIND